MVRPVVVGQSLLVLFNDEHVADTPVGLRLRTKRLHTRSDDTYVGSRPSARVVLREAIATANHLNREIFEQRGERFVQP